MWKPELAKTYLGFARALEGHDPDRDRAMQKIVGGEFEAIGVLEREIVIQHGLRPDGYLIDVGCGSGRLAKPLAHYLDGRYLGIDIVPNLIDYARTVTQRPDWRFEVVSGLEIPERDETADVVCFFSVFTHLLHEQSYAYLREAKRVLRPGGRIVFSFLEFALPDHWSIFEANVADTDGKMPLNMFVGRDAITAWASHLYLAMVALIDGDDPQTPLPEPVTLANGTVTSELSLGQSVAVLERT
jgi:SAM-dependent methyltransferase